jgi:hypothetical protein
MEEEAAAENGGDPPAARSAFRHYMPRHFMGLQPFR